MERLANILRDIADWINPQEEWSIATRRPTTGAWQRKKETMTANERTQKRKARRKRQFARLHTNERETKINKRFDPSAPLEN